MRIVSQTAFLLFALLLSTVDANQSARTTKAPNDNLGFQNTPAIKVSEYPAYNCEDEMAILDSYALKVQGSPESTAYVIVYGGQHRRRGEVAMRMSRIKHYLLTNRMISANRTRIVDGGYRKKLAVELWLIPPSESPPPLAPSLRPEQVRFMRGKIQRWEYTCERLGS
jgi:hypothetical protein